MKQESFYYSAHTQKPPVAKISLYLSFSLQTAFFMCLSMEHDVGSIISYRCFCILHLQEGLYALLLNCSVACWMNAWILYGLSEAGNKAVNP